MLTRRTSPHFLTILTPTKKPGRHTSAPGILHFDDQNGYWWAVIDESSFHTVARFSALRKNNQTLQMLEQLKQRLGVGAFNVVDHWEGDLQAVGIAHPSDEYQLVYIAADQLSGKLYVELETAARAGSQVPYSISGRYPSVTFDELVELVDTHFSNPGLTDCESTS